jgi:hypothetical protein
MTAAEAEVLLGTAKALHELRLLVALVSEEAAQMIDTHESARICAAFLQGPGQVGQG